MQKCDSQTALSAVSGPLNLDNFKQLFNTLNLKAPRGKLSRKSKVEPFGLADIFRISVKPVKLQKVKAEAFLARWQRMAECGERAKHILVYHATGQNRPKPWRCVGWTKKALGILPIHWGWWQNHSYWVSPCVTWKKSLKQTICGATLGWRESARSATLDWVDPVWCDSSSHHLSRKLAC